MGVFSFLDKIMLTAQEKKALTLERPAEAHEFLVLEKDICKWLKRVGITKYSLVKDIESGEMLAVDVFESVDLRGKNLTFIPVKFNKIDGGFNCSENRLLSLKGSPFEVTRGFYCLKNSLTDLEGATKHIRGDFNCGHNLLTSLKGAPQHVPGAFECYGNFLETLEFGPKYVGQNYECENNSLINLDFLPEKVDGFFICNGNDIVLEKYGIEDMIHFGHVAQKAKAYKEKELLSNSIEINSSSMDKKTNKI